eukprot:SAG25_NODE_698_length_5888_cov_30.722059_2_plen_167_part_00
MRALSNLCVHLSQALDPEGLEDVTIENFAAWISSSDKAAMKVLSKMSKLAKKAKKAAAAKVDPAELRQDRIKALFGGMDRSGHGVVRVDTFESLGADIEVVLTKGEMSRVIAQLDPSESGEISDEVFTEWMMDAESPTFNTVRKLYHPQPAPASARPPPSKRPLAA